MKLCRYGKVGYERPGVIDAEGRLRDLSKIIGNIGPKELSPRGLKMLSRPETARRGNQVSASGMLLAVVVILGKITTKPLSEVAFQNLSLLAMCLVVGIAVWKLHSFNVGGAITFLLFVFPLVLASLRPASELGWVNAVLLAVTLVRRGQFGLDATLRHTDGAAAAGVAPETAAWRCAMIVDTTIAGITRLIWS